ncbi:MAG: 2-amino-4-hydroxy-6-hydroxymethyldihydropteridine diphosphokinase [Candidatus Binatia bacterium]
MSHRAFVAVGTNLGKKEANYLKALEKIEELPDTRITGRSSLYETEPHGKARNWFLNAVVELSTGLEARELMAGLRKIEDSMGRKRDPKKTTVSRIIDLDILLFDTEIVDTKKLTIPHPEMQFRRFVLLPMSELAPSLVHPKLEQTISSLLVATTDTKRVTLYRRGLGGRG